MAIILRQIEETDNAALAHVIRKVFDEFNINQPGTVYTDPTTDSLFELFQTPKSAYWVAEQNGVIIGGCGLFPTQGLPVGYAELVKYYLLASYRGEGVGKLLMQVTLNTAKSFGYTHLYLETFPELKGAVGLYSGLGFELLNAPLGNSGHHGCTIWMHKEL